jgi:glycosyltransferase involved in cell wall biosynthesis
MKLQLGNCREHQNTQAVVGQMAGYSKITVITPTLNCAESIVKCIQSVASQDYSNIEHIVVDGKSTDGTLDFLKQYNVTIICEKDIGIYDAIKSYLQKIERKNSQRKFRSEK